MLSTQILLDHRNRTPIYLPPLLFLSTALSQREAEDEEKHSKKLRNASKGTKKCHRNCQNEHNDEAQREARPACDRTHSNKPSDSKATEGVNTPKTTKDTENRGKMFINGTSSVSSSISKLHTR